MLSRNLDIESALGKSAVENSPKPKNLLRNISTMSSAVILYSKLVEFHFGKLMASWLLRIFIFAVEILHSQLYCHLIL